MNCGSTSNGCAVRRCSKATNPQVLQLKRSDGYSPRTMSCRLHQPRGGDGYPDPARYEAHSADGRDRTEPALVCEGQHVKRAGEHRYPNEKTGPRTGHKRLSKRQNSQNERMNEMIENGCLPNVACAVSGQSVAQGVRTKCTQGDREHSSNSGDSEGKNVVHVLKLA